MADDEQFSLCWNNFNSNLSAGFHESLCRGDLVDVTLAAEGQLVKAHRLVLSVCSPYFRKMFTQMPANQHAFVFLKDVSHTALKDLIQFMYCGEVNVKQEALPAFISTAEALQIKGLTDSDPPPSQSPAKPSTPAPQPSPIQQIPSPRVRHRASTSRSYNIESIDESEDSKQATQIVIQTTTPQKAQTTIVQQPQHHHQTQQHYQSQQQSTNTVTTTNVTNKRPAQRNSSGTSSIKRTKSTIDPLEATETVPNAQQISVQTVVTESKPVQQQNEPEYMDLPMELPPKSEPDYTEEAGEAESAEQEASYVEDDSYGDMRYDESYFTENEEAANTTASGVSGNISAVGASTSKAIVKQQPFSDSSYAEATDQTNNEAQETLTALMSTPIRRRGRPKLKPNVVPNEKLIDKITAAVSKGLGEPTVYASATKGGMKLVYNGHHFTYSFRKGQYSIFQCCYKENKKQCKVRVVSNQKRVFHLDGEHVHFIQATDKSVTSLIFETGENQVQDSIVIDSDHELEKTKSTDNVLSENERDKKITDLVPEPSIDQQRCHEVNSSNEIDSQPDLAANYFRERIKKRLQKALLGKKK